MATRAAFEFDPMFDDNLLHWRGSLNGVGDVFRRTSDRYAAKARTIARRRADTAMADLHSRFEARFTGTGKSQYKRAKAMYYSLRKFSELIYAVEEHGVKFNRSLVAAGHGSGAEIEFGGTDKVIALPDGSMLVYPAQNILREAVT